MPIPGSVLQNRYETSQVLGRGSSSVVYLSQNRRLERQGVVREDFYHGQDFVRQFSFDAQLLARLRHPALPRW